MFIQYIYELYYYADKHMPASMERAGVACNVQLILRLRINESDMFLSAILM